MPEGHSVERAEQGVEGDGELFVVVPTIDTAIYADGDVLFDWVEIPNAVRRKGDIGYIKSVTVIDKADQATGYELYIASANGTLGTVNAAPSISDANMVANQVQHLGDILAAEMKDLGGARVATKQDRALQVQAAAASRSLWIGGRVLGGTPTYGAATDLALLVGIMWK
jgi:hypothetical protein